MNANDEEYEELIKQCAIEDFLNWMSDGGYIDVSRKSFYFEKYITLKCKRR